MQVSLGRCLASIVVVALAAPVVAQRAEPGPAPQFGRPFLTRLTTPLLTTDLTHGGTWICSAVNSGNDPLTVTVRAFNQNGQEVSFDDHTCTLEPGKTCTRFWQTGIAGHYCRFTFQGAGTAIRAGLQVSDADGFSLFAEAH